MTSFAITLLLFNKVFLWMLLGFGAAGFLKLKPAHTRFLLQKVFMNILLPCLMFKSIFGNIDASDTYSIIRLIMGAAGMILLGCGICAVMAKILKLPANVGPSFIICTTFQNYALMAFPMVYALLGPKGLALLFVYTFTCDALFWTLGALILSRDRQQGFNWKGIITTPGVTVVTCMPIAIIFYPVHIPDVIMSTLHWPGQIAMPAGLFCVGALIQYGLTGVNNLSSITKPLAWSLGMRSIFFPLLWIGLITLIMPRGPISSILYIQGIMPASLGILVLISLYKGHQIFGAGSTLISNILAIITLPVYLSLVIYWNLLAL